MPVIVPGTMLYWPPIGVIPLLPIPIPTIEGIPLWARKPELIILWLGFTGAGLVIIMLDGFMSE